MTASVIVAFAWEHRNRRNAVDAMPGEQFAFAADEAANLVQAGYGTSSAFTRVRFTAPATIAAPSPYAGTYAVGDQLFTFDATTASALIVAGQAVEAPPVVRPA